jgi:hypothetical protein
MSFAAPLIAAAAISVAAPTAQDIDWARATSMPGNFTHCVRFKNLRCKGVSGQAIGRFECTYREYENKGPWPKKIITVEKIDGQWTKISGDTPKCAVMSLETGN